jgi:hypothetical protein
MGARNASTPRALRRCAVAACSLFGLVALAPASAQVPPPPIPPILSPSPSPSPSSAPSPRPAAGKPQPKTASPTSTRRRAPAGPAPTPYTGAIRDAIAYWESLPKTNARTTEHLLELLQQLQAPSLALAPEALMRGMGPFPVAGYTWYQDDWLAPRYLPYFHLHEGIDLFSREGTPVIASADGVVLKLANGSIGGVSIWLSGDDHVVYYYGHLKAYAPGVAVGRRVRVGDLLAWVGNSGIAAETYPHLHFEVHPLGGPPVSPKPVLDAWLFQAEARAIAAIKAAAISPAALAGAARWRALLGLMAEPAATTSPAWPLALDPAQATMLFAQAALARIATEVDWAKVAERDAAAALLQAEQAARAAYAAAAAADPLGELSRAPGSSLGAARIPFVR